MLALLTAIAIATLPFLAVAALLALAEALDRRRAERTARQVEVTDAIHARLGAVVAPTVEAPVRGAWRLRIPVPFDRPGLVGEVLATAHGALRRRRDREFQIVLVARPERIGG